MTHRNVWYRTSAVLLALALGAAFLAPAAAEAAPSDPPSTGTAVVSGTPVAPVVEVASVNAGTMIARSGCVTVGLGGDTAYECGDLRIVHPLPATRTLNRTRAPMLVYNHQHARPFPIIQADVRLPAGASVPTTVEAVLQVPGQGNTYTRTWSGSDWTPGETRRIGVSVEGLWLTTGFRPYTLEVTFWYGSTPYRADPITGEYTVVSRRHSPFGSGWWLAGLEWIQRQPPDWTSLIWVGGDGSTRRFSPRPGYANEWLSEVFDGPPDTLSYHSPTNQFRRSVRGGGSVYYDGAGNHIRTVDRLGRTTTFNHALVNNVWRLTEIVLPVASGTAPKYSFSYDASGRLREVSAPPRLVGPTGSVEARLTQLTPSGSSRDVVQITDPDGHSVHFGYHPTYPHTIASRTDRRGTTTQFGFNNRARFVAGHRDMQDGTVISHQFDPQESLGVLTSTSAFDTHTFIDGPRTDVADHTRIWVNRWGAPVRIRDARGSETQVFRGNAAFPGLVTRTIAPNGYDQRAAYDTQGRLTRTIGINSLGDARNDTTTYTYGSAAWPYFPTRVTLPEKNFVAFGYDNATGNRIWEQVGPSSARRVNYFYNAVGQVDSVRMPTVSGGTVRPVERYGYDARGNLTSVTTPTGIVTRYHADAIGRDTLVVGPTTSERIVYDLMGRVETSTTSAWRYDPTQKGGGLVVGDPVGIESITAINTYDAEGNPTQIDRQLSPNPAHLTRLWTKWQYDRAGRVTRIEHPDLTVETFVHEGNGQALRHRPRGCGASTCEIVTRYDVLGRDSVRVVPHRDFTGSDWTPTYRLDPNTSLPANRIAADTSRFTYDAMGNLRTADNREARIRRNYYRGGLLHTDSTWIRDYGSASFNQVYGQRMVYDRNGRRLDLYYPSGTGPGTAPRVQYGYHAETGLLSSIVDLGGNAFGYEHDAQGNTHRVFMPGGLVDTRVLDLESRLTYRTVPGYRSVNYFYTEAGQLQSLWADGSQRWFEAQYTGLGSVVRTQGVTHEFHAPYPVSIYPNDLSVDPLGNVVYAPVHSSQNVIIAYPTETWTNYTPSGQVSSTLTGDTIWIDDGGGSIISGRKEFRISASGWFMTDGSGNQALSSRETVREWYQHDPMTPVRTVQETTRSYYGWDGKLRVVDQTKRYCQAWAGCESFEFGSGILDEPPAVFEEYRYDALGRRIMVRGRPDPRCTLAGCEAYLDSYVWDGAQILSEFRQGTAGGRVTYTHGPGIDAPVSLWRSGTTMVLHANRGGLIDMATYTNGTRVDPDPYTWAGLQSPLYPRYASHARGTQWLGSLVANKHDGSGLVYMRNRYLNPQTGQFTQSDPIGLAGGLNLYGYAGGDPVNFHDPFGLYIVCRTRGACRLWNRVYSQAQAASLSDDRSVREAGASLLARLDALRNSDEPVFVTTRSNSRLRRAADWLMPNLFPVNYSGPCVHQDRDCGAGKGYGIVIDPEWSKGKDVSAETRFVHEVGHINAFMAGGDQAQESVDAENSYRTIRGCTHRPSHSGPSAPCN